MIRKIEANPGWCYAHCDDCGGRSHGLYSNTDEYREWAKAHRPVCPMGEAGNVSAAYMLGVLLALLPGTLVAFVLASLAGGLAGVA